MTRASLHALARAACSQIGAFTVEEAGRSVVAPLNDTPWHTVNVDACAARHAASLAAIEPGTFSP
jgi:hypothetical protein